MLTATITELRRGSAHSRAADVANAPAPPSRRLVRYAMNAHRQATQRTGCPGDWLSRRPAGPQP
jgi:hypothetical protein